MNRSSALTSFTSLCLLFRIEKQLERVGIGHVSALFIHALKKGPWLARSSHDRSFTMVYSAFSLFYCHTYIMQTVSKSPLITFCDIKPPCKLNRTGLYLNCNCYFDM